MKIILLISFISSLVLATQSQVVLGTFSTAENAKKAVIIMEKLVSEDENTSVFFQKSGVKTLYKEHGKYYVVSMEPFYDKASLLALLTKAKTKFKDAYTSELSVESHKRVVDDPLLQEEPDLDDLKIPEPVAQTTTIKKDVVEKTVLKVEPTEKKNNSKAQKESIMTETYLIEMIAFILILLLIVIYFIYKNARVSKNNSVEEILQPLNLQEEEAQTQPTKTSSEYTQPEESKVLEVHERTEAINLDALTGTEEGTFGEESEVAENEVTEEEVALTREVEVQPNIIARRAVPTHDKIAKNDFTLFAGTKILVAEDNLINQKVISGLLADTGIEITIADDGQEALDILAKSSDFTMVLMDAHMPRVDGFEATRQIRANPNYNHIVVIALSGDTASDDIKKMSEAGMADHLEKPLRMDALYDVLYAYTGKDEKTPTESESEFIEVVMTKELNGAQGLDICGGDESFYHEILDEFVASYTHSSTKLEDLIKSDNFKEADALLFDIIGVSANIGAETLKGIAENLRKALKNEQSYLDILSEYKKHLNLLLKDIKEYK